MTNQTQQDKFIYLPIYLSDYVSDSRKLTMLQRGALIDLSVLYFQENLKINYQKEQLYRLVFAFSKDEQEAVDFILENYFTKSENKPTGFYWVSNRLNELGDKILKRLNSSRENGKKGGRGKKKENKPIGLNSVNLKPNLDESILNESKLNEIKTKKIKNKLNENNIYKELSNNLQFVLEEKLQRKLSSRNWIEDIKKLIEKDLSVRPNPIEDVKRAIQTIADNYGKDYFPVIQSAKSLKEKFTMIENFVKRNTATQIPQTNSVSSSFDEKKKFYLENRNRIHPNLNEINDILNKIDNNQSKTQIIAYKAKTAFFVSNNANANLDLDEKLEKYFDLIVVLDYKTKEKYES